MSSTQLAGLLVLFLCTVALIQFPFDGQSTSLHQHNSILNTTPSTAGNSTPFNYVVVIVMENQGVCDILPSLACNTANIGLAPYMTSLAASYGLAANYTAITHPSMPNYLSLFSGRDWGCQGYDGGPNSNSCTTTAWSSTGSNLVDRLEASGLTWKAYMENMTSNCDINDSGYYAARHDPFVYFNDIYNSQARCKNIVPALANDTALLNDLASTTTATNLMWLTPNLCNDMHDDCTTSQSSHPTCDGSGGNVTYCIRQGDTFLSRLVPMILDSTIFRTQNALLYVTFDEGNGYCPTGYANRDCIPTVLAGPVIKKSHVSALSYSHFSFLSTLEAAWGVSPLTANDTTAPPMSEFFTTLFPPHISSSSVSPEAGQIVQLHAIVRGGTGPYSFSWKFGDNTIATGDQTSHSFVSPGSYTITVNATDSLGANATSTQTVSVADGPTVSFSSSLPSPQIGQSIIFTANANAGTPPYVFKWDFGDFRGGTGSQLAHTYSSAGSFSVKVNATDAVGALVSQSQVMMIGKRNSSTSLACLPSTTTINQTITCTSTVTDTSSGLTSTPTGMVTIESNVLTDAFNANSCTLINGSCSVTVTASRSGNASITSAYAGDTSHSTSSAISTLTVNLRPTSATLSCPTNGSTGVALSCTVTVSDSSPGTVSTPTGDVTLTPSGSCILIAGSCSITFTPSAAGELSVSASYTSNDGVHSGSSASSTITISTISSVSNNKDSICLLTACYPSTAWMIVAVGTVLLTGSLALFWVRARPRHSRALK